MASSRTIEEFVSDIVHDIETSQYEDLGDVYDTLQRMQSSLKQKHEHNYWRVIQCLVEVAIDKIVLKLIRIDSVSCKCHLGSNMLCVMRFFVESITTVNVIKRVIQFRDSFGPICFKMIRHSSEEELIILGYETIYRCLCVGKTELAEWYIKYGIMKDLYQFVKWRYDASDFSSMSAHGVLLCSEILLLIAECCSENVRKQIRLSTALKVLAEYIVKFKKQKVATDRLKRLVYKFLALRSVLTDEKLAVKAFSNWKAKEKLQGTLEEVVLLFCSSPGCRKLQKTTEKFRYCGACKLARYCSEKCQKEHWKAGHKSTCLRQPLLHDE